MKSAGALSPLKQALLALESLEARLARSEAGGTEPIAIIGMACRFPGARNAEEFWTVLKNGRDCVREVPPSRWDINAYYDPDPDAPGKMSTRWGGFLDDIENFDAEFFGISPREAAAIDPQQRLLLEVAWEALEDAAQGPRELAAFQTGVFVGLTGDEYAQLFHRQGDLSVFNSYFASGIARSVAGGRISYALGIQGPNLSIDTACSSSLVAVHTACLNLRMGECRMALAGGSNIILAPEIGIAFSKAHMMAADGRCKAFDARADGFVRAEGCGIVVLKRFSDAVADGDHVLALIRGSSVNQDGRSSGLTVPNRRAQEAVIRRALAKGNVQSLDIGYVEAHGTGTTLGDPIEAQALSAVLGPGRTPDNPLLIGSVKANLGHLESTAGIAGLIKVILALQHQQIPPQIHFEKLNPHINWGNAPIEVPVQIRSWARGERKRLAGVSAFGFSGTNAHVVVEEAPIIETPRRECERPSYILALSARSAAAVQELAGNYVDELGKTDAAVGDLCFTANSRMQFEYRLAVSGDSVKQLRSRLLEAPPVERVSEREGTRAVFLFPGQGAQYAGMGKELYETQPVFRRTIDECAELLSTARSESLRDVLWGSRTGLLNQTAYTQPALFALEYALAQLWKSWGIQPSIVLGHSVGEYVAACVAGIYSLGDGIRLIAERARLMQEVEGEAGMAAVLAPEEKVREALRGLERRVSIAALNAAQNVVISGYKKELDQACERLRAAEVKVQPLGVSHAFHSPQIALMADAFEAAAAAVHYRIPEIPLVSSVSGEVITRKEPILASYWRRQVLEPVRFQQAMETLRRQDWKVFIEVGPGTTLASLARQSIAENDVLFVTSLKSGRGEWKEMLESLRRLYVRGADVDWHGFDEPYDRKRVSLPGYPFERRRHWIGGTARSGLKVTNESRGHPLIDRRFEMAGDVPAQICETEISFHRYPYLAGHNTSEGQVFSPAAFVEMMMAAVCDGTGGAVELRDLVIPEPLLLSGDGTTLLQVIRRGSNVEIYQRGTDRWKRHVAATVALAQPAQPGCDATQLQRRMPRTIEVADFYADIRERGMDFGPDFRGIKKIHQGESESLAYVAASDALANDLAGYDMHPALLEACFQSLIGTLAEQEKDYYLPVAIDRFARYRRSGGELWAHAKRRPAREMKPESIKIDFTLFDQYGTVAEVEGMELRRAGAARCGREQKGLFELQWHPAERGLEKVAIEGDWLILGDRGGTGSKLAKRLSEHGARCTVLTQDAGLTTLLNGQAFRGVIHLWGLDATTVDRLALGLLADSQHSLIAGMLDLAQKLATSPETFPPRLWLVTRGAQAAVKEQSRVEAVQSMVWGLAQAIAEEHSEWRCCCIDLDPEDADIDALIAEICSGEREEQVALRGSQRLVARLVPTSAVKPDTPPKSPIAVAGDATYLIVGGLGAVGRHLARWLVAQGARCVVLAGRSKVDPPGDLVNFAESQGARIVARSADVSRESEMADLFSEIATSMPALRGVIHCAAVMDDGLFVQQTWDRFRGVAVPKVEGSWILHELTRSLELDFFILFSSAAAVAGAPGQASYAAANAFQDALAQHRRSLGLPALSINWGAWNIGIAARADLQRRQQTLGLIPMPADAGLDLLRQAMLSGEAQIGAGWFNWDRFVGRFPESSVPRRFARLRNDRSLPERAEGRESSLLDRLLSAPESSRPAILQQHVHAMAGRVLGFSGSIDSERALQEMGLDSLMSVELRDLLAASVRQNLPSTLIFQHPTVNSLSAYLLDLIFKRDPTPKTVFATPSTLDLIEELSDDEVDRLLASKGRYPS